MWKGKRQPGQHGENTQFVPQYALLVKIESRANLALEGHTYCVRWNEFAERFPEVPLRY